jgi:hypothetical protein
MTPGEFRDKHPRIFNEILERGAHAERMRVRHAKIKDRNPSYSEPLKYGDPKNKALIASELPLLA